MRKSYHVMTYAKNAIRYHKKFSNDDGFKYLRKAYGYLIEELDQNEYIPSKIRKEVVSCKRVIESLLDTAR